MGQRQVVLKVGGGGGGGGFFREKSPKVHLTIIRECSKNTPHLDVKKF